MVHHSILKPIGAALLCLFLAIIHSGSTSSIVTSMPPMEKSEESIAVQHIIDPDSEVRGVWIASVWNIDFPSAPDLSASALKAEIDEILSVCAKNGLNTVFFQVRPSADALYDSAIFPISANLSSERKLVFDPLDYIVGAAHQHNIRVHAWVNPLRVTVAGDDRASLPEKSPARLHPDWVVSYGGKLCFNAGLPEVRSLVADGVKEIVAKYDVDGVVFDDYFYPYPAYDDAGKWIDFPDEEAYQKYGKGYASKEDWRRENTNKLVHACYDAIHAADPECVFGVAPYAVWKNSDGKNGGSRTNSLESYKYLFCDAPAWIDGGYVDYISPQIYWDFDTASSPFDVLTRWWNDRLDGSDVKLYVSHAAYKYEEGEWADPAGELAEQVTYARSERSYYGSVFYGYEEIKRNVRGAADDIRRVFEPEIIYSRIQSNGLGVTVSAPVSGSVLESDTTYIMGLSDPYYPLTVNGERLGRTKSGYFSFTATLEDGENVFEFEQNGKIYRYTLTYNAKTGAVGETGTEKEVLNIKNTFGIGAVYPASDVATGEDILWVSCEAPVDADVKAVIGGVETELVPLSDPKTRTSDDGWVYISYGANAKLPDAPEGVVFDCGAVRFTAEHHDGNLSAEGIRVSRVGKNACIPVRVTKDSTPLKISLTSSYYNDYTVQSAGMTADALALYGGYYILPMGGFVPAENVEVLSPSAKRSPLASFSSASVKNAGKTTDFFLATSSRPAYNGHVENGVFTVTFFDVDSASAPEPKMEANPLFTSCTVNRQEKRVRYEFRLFDPMNFYGFELEYKDDGVAVHIRNPICVNLSAPKPLKGVKIVLDAGHGGSDPGAFGPLRIDGGFSNCEKDLNLSLTLAVAEKLRALGATVDLLRSDDSTLDLLARAAILDEKKPDLCLSLHQNSMGYTADITRIRGTLGLWWEAGGRLLADCVGHGAASALERNYRGTEQQMLAMCRNPKFPAALVEIGFMTSVEEYEYMTSPRGKEAAAQGVTDGILAYFAKMTAFSDAASVQNRQNGGSGQTSGGSGGSGGSGSPGGTVHKNPIVKIS